MDNGNISPSFRTERYEWLKVHTSFDLIDIDDEVMEMPVLLQEAGECTAIANENRDRAKEELQNTSAAIAHSLREDKSNGKRSETTIEASIPLYQEFKDKQAALDSARLDAALWTALTDALRSKSMAIRIAADLLQSGYLTPSYIRDKRRRQIRGAEVQTT